MSEQEHLYNRALADLQQALVRIDDQLDSAIEVTRRQGVRLTLREQTAGSVFVGLLTAYYQSNGGLSCSAATVHHIATAAWSAAHTLVDVSARLDSASAPDPDCDG